MFNTTKLLKKLAVLTLFFFILIPVAVDLNFAQNEDILERARTLYKEGNKDEAISELNEFINSIKGIPGQEKKAAEAFFVLAQIYFTYQRIGEESKVDENLKMAFKMYPELDFSKEEPDREFKAKVEQIKIDFLRNKIENTNFITRLPGMEVKKKEKEFSPSEGIGAKENQNSKLNYKIIILVILGAVLAGAAVTIILLFPMILRLKRITREPKNNVPTLDMLWGKLDPQSEGLNIIDLSKESPGLTLTPPKNLPVLKMCPANRKGKKVITISHEEGLVRFYKRNRKEANNQYIDAETCFFKILLPENKISHEYKFNFLNKMSEICENPVWSKDEFKGRDTIIKEIKDNFLKKGGDCYHYLISGMGNSGKTSLMQHLYHIGLGQEGEILQRYSLALVEFNHKDYTTFTGLEKEITKQLESYKGGQRKLILIDEYDKLYEKFPGEFCEYIREYSSNKEYFFILSGRKGRDLLEKRFFEHMSPFIDCKKLEGLDYIRSIPGETCEKSLELIESLISDIGFPGQVLDKDTRHKIITYASGFPSLIKKILLELIIDWLAHFDKKTINAADVEEAVSKIKEHTKDFLLRRAIDFDERFYKNPDEIPVTVVRIRDILNILSENFKGKAPKRDIKNILIRLPAGDAAIEDRRKRSFDEKIRQLTDMGFIKEDGGDLIGIPHLCFYKGERII